MKTLLALSVYLGIFLQIGIFSINAHSSIALPLDLELASQDFVLETKRIEIPGYPHAFNPGIIRWQGRLLLSFRVILDPRQPFNSEIGLVFLDENFSSVGEPQLLSLRDEYSLAPCRAEDARLITCSDKLLMVYDDNVEPILRKGGFRVYVAKVNYTGEYFVASPIECLKWFENESQHVREKSWAPFIYKENLLLAYSLLPHRIFSPRLDGTGICDTVTCTQSAISWGWGTLRGGTSAFLEEEGYLAFFHSSTELVSSHSEGKKITHYFIGAYLFSQEPPFDILKISPTPIIGKNFYRGTRYKPYWKPIRCVFPCGYISNDQYIWITYGRDDHEAWVAKIDKKKLLQSLVPCT